MAAVESSHGSTAIRAPPLTQSDAVTSLLSLGLQASEAAPIPIPTQSNELAASANSQQQASLSTAGPGSLDARLAGPNPGSSVGASSAGKHHRRLSSIGKTRRRLSDAREASVRPLLVSSSPASSAALSLSALSISTSPGHTLTQKTIAPRPTNTPSGISIAALNGSGPAPVHVGLRSRTEAEKDTKPKADERDREKEGSTPIPIIGANGKPKKRGIDYKCESCAKVYRHPNCLNKHRWEHTRHWREASKFVLSKHQQVQLLEAATILSFMGKCSTSLPEDRSEWPSFLSGGSLPMADGSDMHTPAPPTPIPAPAAVPPPRSTTMTYPLHPISASVPSGPRLHDYSLPSSGSGGKATITQLRPGLVGVPTVPVPLIPTPTPTSAFDAPVSALSGGLGGWSLPSSSVRSESSSSRSRSGSRSGSSDVEIDVDVEGLDDPNGLRAPGSHSYGAYPAYGSYGTPSGGFTYPTAASRSPYGAYPQSYGRRGVMKREEDEMSVGFSVREEDEDEEEMEDEEVRTKRHEHQRKWDGMEMDFDMDMD